MAVPRYALRHHAHDQEPFSGCFSQSLVNSVFLPFWADALTGDAKMAQEIGEIVRAGNVAVTPEDVQAARRQLAAMGYTRALSWVDESAGGSLVAPPQMGELIDLLRNNEVLMAAGARVLPMPPQGRITFPRHTSAATAYHVGESVNLTESQQGTGDVVLQAKKLTILNKIPNELFHFAAIPIEAFVREDMMRVIALKLDKTLLEDVGSSTTPKGLINYSGITSYTSLGTAADAHSGYPIHPADPTNMIGNVEEKNATFRSFIMRSLLWATLVNGALQLPCRSSVE
jgi:HK97 family phage major capsid protein